jgi:type I site-specific restriction endonuclease
MQQALDYAASLQVPFVFSSNGKSFVFHDQTGLIAQGEPIWAWTSSQAPTSSGPSTGRGRA